MSTSYEVQVMQAGKWRIHAQFPASGRDDALEEAKTLEALPGIAGIKVIRDSYDDRSGLHQEHVIHKHVPKRPAADASANKYAHYMQRASANRAAQIKDPVENEPRRARKKSSFLTVIIKLLLVLLFSIGVAAVLTLILNETMPYKKIGGIAFYGDMRVKIMMGASLVFFVISLISMFKVFLGREELSKPDLALLERNRREAEREKARRKAEADKRAREKEKEKEKKKRTKEEEEELKRKAEEELKRKAEEEEKRKAQEEEEKKEQEDDAEDEADEEEEDYSNLSPIAQAQKQYLMGFFGEAIRALPAERKKMDNYNRFGVNLYLAGATEALGGEKNLDLESVTIILADALQMMGLKPEHAEAFAKRYEDYLLQDPRYMEMFQAGRRDLSSYLGGEQSAPANLDQALHEWNKPKKPDDPEKEVVVMFTDIVGSTALTHEKGNMAAQEVVRAHNKIVRDALSKTGGKEIKHTGDGIMASFDNVTQSLLATQQIQSMVQINNAQTGDESLKIKIGINAGRAVMEEQDLYGVTVQMAARIVDKAKADQIFVSDTVFGLAKGGDWRFVKRGPYYLKGIDGPAFLHEFVWDDKADLDTVKARADAERPGLEQAYAAATGQSAPQATPTGDATAGADQAAAQPAQPQAAQSQAAQSQAQTPSPQASPPQAPPSQTPPPGATQPAATQPATQQPTQQPAQQPAQSPQGGPQQGVPRQGTAQQTPPRQTPSRQTPPRQG